jgi:hypothetical protein
MFLVVSDGVSSEWSSVGMSGSARESRFSIKLNLEDGDDHQVSFQGYDVAGNGATISDANTIVVDTTGPVFGEVTPGPEDKQPGTEVTVTVTLDDAIIGVNGTTVEYRFATNGHLPEDDWREASATLQPDGSFKVELALTLVRGMDNLVQFRADDLLGNRGSSGEAVVWVNRLPIAVIESPTTDVRYQESEPVALSANGTEDPDGDDLNFTWWAENGLEPLGYGKRLSASLLPGTYNITLVVKDDVGGEDTASVQVTVEKFVPPKSSDGSNGWWLVLIIIIVAAGAAAGYYVYRRRRTFEPVE